MSDSSDIFQRVMAFMGVMSIFGIIGSFETDRAWVDVTDEGEPIFEYTNSRWWGFQRTDHRMELREGKWMVRPLIREKGERFTYIIPDPAVPWKEAPPWLSNSWEPEHDDDYY